MSVKRKVNKRAVVSVILFITFVLMPVSGKMVQLSERDFFWVTLHGLSGQLFMIAGVFHIVYNWKTFKQYISRKKE
jgi:putative Mn2+ efflux pump MntP